MLPFIVIVLAIISALLLKVSLVYWLIYLVIVGILFAKFSPKTE